MIMSKQLRIAVVQMNAVVGGLAKNRDKIIAGMLQAKAYGCDLVAFPELCITGYPPEDLVSRRQFIIDQRQVLDEIINYSNDIISVVGFVDGDRILYNAAAVVQNKALVTTYHKIQLPNYSVFDEERYFESGKTPLILDIEGCKVGISICEDIWIEGSVTETEAIQGGAEVLLNLSASPYAAGKVKERISLLNERSRFCRAFVVYANLVGGQDELVFDGSSMIVNPEGEIIVMASRFDEDLIALDIDFSSVIETRKNPAYLEQTRRFKSPFPACRSITLARSTPQQTCELKPRTFNLMISEEEEIYSALILGLRDYVLKNGFQHIILGLSGGIDSALVAALAADALGAECVHGVTMPSRYSSSGSVNDSYQLAGNLN
ncbi:MAG: NAD+ synthase, partial [Calditrichaeota bacterium]